MSLVSLLSDVGRRIVRYSYTCSFCSSMERRVAACCGGQVPPFSGISTTGDAAFVERDADRCIAVAIDLADLGIQVTDVPTSSADEVF